MAPGQEGLPTDSTWRQTVFSQWDKLSHYPSWTSPVGWDQGERII